MGMSYLDLTHSLADAFNSLADEAQDLNDRRIVLEHKLRFAHEQVSYRLSCSPLVCRPQVPPHPHTHLSSEYECWY